MPAEADSVVDLLDPRENMFLSLVDFGDTGDWSDIPEPGVEPQPQGDQPRCLGTPAEPKDTPVQPQGATPEQQLPKENTGTDVNWEMDVELERFMTNIDMDLYSGGSST